MPTPCFWTKPTGTEVIYLRRYSRKEEGRCQGCGCSYHQAAVEIDRVPTVWKEWEDTGRQVNASATSYDKPDEDDSRWPQGCANCDYVFTPDDHFQVTSESIYQGTPPPFRELKTWTLRELPPGAMYDAWWMPDSYRGDDGIALVVVLPNGRTWLVDSRASNCTEPEREHHCWVRHGTPPKVTVDKAGDTCGAGGGSIQAKDYHGFLQNGVLTDSV